jgi:hypothetical protein
MTIYLGITGPLVACADCRALRFPQGPPTMLSLKQSGVWTETLNPSPIAAWSLGASAARPPRLR